jgi:pyruvate dehydrogenase E2 component (dihydrolipoamide acetyltransferase)
MEIFKLPDLGEGLPDAEIVAWHVTEGTEVKIDQSLVSMETAKAVVEVPSPVSGRIIKLYGKPGDVIKTGEALVEYESTSAHRPDTGTVAGTLQASDKLVVEPLTTVSTQSGQAVKATPAVRALAQRLKVDLARITPTGTNQTITLQDVQQCAAQNTHMPILDPNYTPLTSVRKVMAQAMTEAHKNVVPVTIVDDACLSLWGPRTDISVRIIQAIISACQQEPALNAWYDGLRLSRQLHAEVHLGLAIDSIDGLFVPVIRDAHTLNAAQLREKIDQFKKQASARSFKPEDFQGATIILSNFGKFAGRYANPIIMPPMVAIVGTGSIRQEVVAINNTPTVASVLPLSVSVDHRAVTGGEATRFLSALLDSLKQ